MSATPVKKSTTNLKIVYQVILSIRYVYFKTERKLTEINFCDITVKYCLTIQKFPLNKLQQYYYFHRPLIFSYFFLQEQMSSNKTSPVRKSLNDVKVKS